MFRGLFVGIDPRYCDLRSPSLVHERATHRETKRSMDDSHRVDLEPQHSRNTVDCRRPPEPTSFVPNIRTFTRSSPAQVLSASITLAINLKKVNFGKLKLWCKRRRTLWMSENTEYQWLKQSDSLVTDKVGFSNKPSKIYRCTFSFLLNCWGLAKRGMFTSSLQPCRQLIVL